MVTALLFEVSSDGADSWALWPALHVADILLQLRKPSGREELCKETANTKDCGQGPGRLGCTDQ